MNSIAFTYIISHSAWRIEENIHLFELPSSFYVNQVINHNYIILWTFISIFPILLSKKDEKHIFSAYKHKHTCIFINAVVYWIHKSAFYCIWLFLSTSSATASYWAAIISNIVKNVYESHNKRIKGFPLFGMMTLHEHQNGIVIK